MIHLVCGAPASGKTTFVKERAKPGDLVVDLDALEQATGSRVAAKSARKALEASLGDLNGDAWVIRTLGDSKAREDAVRRLGADKTYILSTPLEINLTRATERGDGPELLDAIREWHKTFVPLDGEELIEPGMGPIRQGDKMSDTFPKDTPVAEMTHEEQAAYWKAQSRKHETRAREAKSELQAIEDLGGLQTITEKLGIYDAEPSEILKALGIDVDELTSQARAEVMQEFTPALVRSTFEAKMAHVPEAIRSAYLEDIDTSQFLDDNGELDTAAIEERSKAFNDVYPSGGDVGSHGGYRRHDSASGISAGAAMYENDNQE